MPVRPRADIRKPHPAKFSEEILRVLGELLDKYKIEGLVLDPFAGSGTTLAAAAGLGRDAIGIDLDPRNLDHARNRLGLFLTEDAA